MTTSAASTPYPIGTPGIPWGAAERATWLTRQRRQRSYANEVVAPLKARLPADVELLQYGVLEYARFGFDVETLFSAAGGEA